MASNNDWLIAAGLGLLAWSFLSNRNAGGNAGLIPNWGNGPLLWTNDEDVGLPAQGGSNQVIAPSAIAGVPTSPTYNPYGYPTSITNINPASWVNPPQLGVNGVTPAVLAQYGLTENDIQPDRFIARNNANMANALTTVTRTITPATATTKAITQISGINSKGQYYALPPRPKGYY
jgi:hypothetical protein